MMQVIGRNEEGNALHESEMVVRWQLGGWYEGQRISEYSDVMHIWITLLSYPSTMWPRVTEEQGRTGKREEKL